MLAALCLLGLFSTEVADTDFWWHLKTGQYIIERHALPVPDPFSYTSQLGAPAYPGEERVRYFNLTHEWLAQALWYLIFRAAGFPGVVLFKALLLAGLCGIAGLLAARRSGSFYWGLAAAGAAAAVAALFSADRPALLTFFFIAVFIWILERGGPLWLLPVLSLVWANAHGGFFLGWVILAAYSADALFARWRGRRAVIDRKLWLAGAVSIAASGLNPSGFRILQILLAYRHSYLNQSLIEWTKPSLWGPPYAFDLLLYAGAAVLLLAWRRVRVADWLLFAAFAAASLAAFRNIILMALLAPVLIAAYFPWRRKLPSLTAPVVVAALVGVLAAGMWRGQFFQLRAALWKFPAGAADWMLAKNISSPMFNTYEYGGYLIWRLWPRERAFIDGRALNESVYRDYVKALGGASAQERQEVLARYGVEVIVANAFEYASGVLYPMVLWLAEPAQSDWQLVYQDPQAMIFLRHMPAGVAALHKTQIPDHLEAECRLHIEKDPELCLCARTLGFLFLRMGDAGRAQRSLALYLANNREPDAEAESAYRRLLAPGR
ncbi:MAG TPA: hypothetical protein VEU62_14830 [Bryobacterales bacterium]|nr:hypothetical protein [Bryobacterales bacterium]